MARRPDEGAAGLKPARDRGELPACPELICTR
jgi:hypothetical protein